MPAPPRLLYNVGMSRKPLIILTALTLVIAALVLAGPRLAIAYLAAQITRAATPDEETAALCQANRWVHTGYTPTYSVTCHDSSGHEVRPWVDGDYARVAVVTLRWSTGQSVERRLLSADPLGCVFGE